MFAMTLATYSSKAILYTFMGGNAGEIVYLPLV